MSKRVAEVSQELMTLSRPRKSRPRRSIAKWSKSKVPRTLSAPDVHSFVRTCSISNIVGVNGFVPLTTGVTPFQLFSIYFTTQEAILAGPAGSVASVAAMPGITDIAALFDEVMLDAVEMTMHVANDAITFGSGNGSGVICLATDYNDNNAPATLGDVQQYRDCKTIPLRSDYVHKQIIKPKFLTLTTTAGGATDASKPERGYLRGNTQIIHNGLKGAFLLPPQSGTVVFTFRFRYKCKTPK